MIVVLFLSFDYQGFHRNCIQLVSYFVFICPRMDLFWFVTFLSGMFLLVILLAVRAHQSFSFTINFKITHYCLHSKSVYTTQQVCLHYTASLFTRHNKSVYTAQ